MVKNSVFGDDKNPPDIERINRFLNRVFLVLMLLSSLCISYAFWPQKQKAPDFGYMDRAVQLHKEPIQPIPLTVPIHREMVELGRRLFHDKRLSADGSVSCASCHNLKTGGVDRKFRSVGVKGRLGEINTPTVLNARWNFRQFWDGRAKSLEEQINGPLTHPKEMGSSWKKVLKVLRGDKAYRKTFGRIFVAGILPENIRKAIAEFERSLITPNARFDQFLRGKKDAITKKEKEGYRLFKKYRCIHCHQGVGIGGNMFQKFGLVGDYFKDRGKITKADYGRYNVTKKEHDRFRFKVPSLRNVELTPPYFHDGSAKTLEDAVRLMGRYQIGQFIPKEDVVKIVAFLKTLTGELKK